MRHKSFHPVVFLALIFSYLGFSQDRPPLVDTMGYADLIVVNGKIASMDDRTSRPDTPGHIYVAMAVKGKKIMALGTDSEMRRLANANTKVVDVGGRTVIPGLINPHFHTYSGAPMRYGQSQGLADPSVKLTVAAEKTAEGTARKLRDTILNAIEVQKIPKGHWISVQLQEGKENRAGTNRNWIYLGNLNRRTLDGAIPNYPVLIRSGVNGLFNAAAITEFKKEFPDWEESTDLENRPGSATDGMVAVPELSAITYELWWKDKPLENVAEMLRLYGVDAQKMGITSIGTRIYLPRVIAAYHKLDREGRMPHRLAYYIEIQRGRQMGLKATREFYQGMGAPWAKHSNGGEMLWLNGMANEIWDSGSFEVCLGPDVPASPEIKARERCPGPGSKPWEAIKGAVVNGWRPAQVHGTSSHGTRLYVQMLDEAMKEGNFSLDYMRSLRTTLEHTFVIGMTPDVIAGVKKYGIILNPSMGYFNIINELIPDYGERLVSMALPIKSWIQEDIRVTFEAAGMDFWNPIYTLVTRKLPRKDKEPLSYLPEEAVDRVTALKMTTTWAAEYLLAEDTLGTLEQGKYADFAVLNKDFFSVPVEEIRTIQVVMTGLGGRIVYDNLAGPDASKQTTGSAGMN